MCFGTNNLKVAGLVAAAWFAPTLLATVGTEAGVAATYGTTAGSAQTAMLAAQEAGMAAASSGTWLSTATPYLQAGSAATSAYGAVMGSEAQSKSDRYNAEVAANNSQVAGWQANDAEARADRQAQDIGRKQASVRGTQAANMAANGLDLSFGSTKATLDQTDTFGLQDQRTAIDAGNKESWALRSRASGFAAESAFSSARADSANPLLAGATSLIGSAGNIADSHARRRYSAGEGGSGFFKS